MLLSSKDLFDDQSAVDIDTKLISLDLEIAQGWYKGLTSIASVGSDRANSNQILNDSLQRFSCNSTDKLPEQFSAPQRKRVQFPTPTGEEKSPQPQNTAALDSQYWPAKSIRFSDLVGMFQRLPERKLSFVEDASVLIERADLIPLSGLLDGPARLGLRHRLSVAASLAWDLVCLISTPWTKHGITIDQIFFLRRNGEIAASEPLIHHKLQSAREKQDTDVAVSLRALMLWFGRTLVELGLCERLSELRSPTETVPLQPAMSDYVAISGLIDRIRHACGAIYGDVVRRCISPVPVDQNRTGEMQEFLYNNILLPLQVVVSESHGSTTPPRSVSLLQVGGAFQPPPKPQDLETRVADLQSRKDPSGIRPNCADLSTEALPLLHRDVSHVCQMCHEHSRVFAPATLEGKWPKKPRAN